jgi:hypothetical protein
MKETTDTQWEDEPEWDDDEPYDRSLDCDHEQADIDILTGRAMCSCGYSWWMTREEIHREAEFLAEYMEAESDVG